MALMQGFKQLVPRLRADEQRVGCAGSKTWMAGT